MFIVTVHTPAIHQGLIRKSIYGSPAMLMPEADKA